MEGYNYMRPNAGELWVDKYGTTIFFFKYYNDNKLHYIYDDGSGSFDDLPEYRKEDYKFGNKWKGWKKIYPKKNGKYGGGLQMMKKIFYLIFAVLTSMVGYTIHESIFWTVMDFIFPVFAWLKWLIFHEVTMSVLRETFAWFFN